MVDCFSCKRADSRRVCVALAERGSENSPYRALLKRRDRSVQVNVRFVDRDSMIVEPDIWEMLPENAREMLSDINLRHGRPEKEFRLLLRREEESK